MKEKLFNTSSFQNFYSDLLDYEQRLILRRKRIEESMNKQNKKPPTIDIHGRYHAPFDGYQWTDGILTKKFCAGEYLPVDDFSEENNYYKLSKIYCTKIMDIQYHVVKEIVSALLSDEKNVILIKRYNKNKAHINSEGQRVVTCETTMTKWHLEHFKKFLQHYGKTRKLNLPNRATIIETAFFLALETTGKIVYKSLAENDKEKFLKIKILSKNNDYTHTYSLFINECINENLIVKNCRLCEFHKETDEPWKVFCLKQNYKSSEKDAETCTHFIFVKSEY